MSPPTLTVFFPADAGQHWLAVADQQPLDPAVADFLEQGHQVALVAGKVVFAKKSWIVHPPTLGDRRAEKGSTRTNAIMVAR